MTGCVPIIVPPFLIIEGGYPASNCSGIGTLRALKNAVRLHFFSLAKGHIWQTAVNAACRVLELNIDCADELVNDPYCPCLFKNFPLSIGRNLRFLGFPYKNLVNESVENFRI